MKATEASKNRRSIRSYLPTLPKKKLIEELVELANLAPTASNLENRQFIVVQDKKTIRKIYEAGCKQSQLLEAPVVIVVATNPALYKPREFLKRNEVWGKEVERARQLTKKPIILNSWVEMDPRKRRLRNLGWQEKSLESCLKFGDVLGLSVYPVYPGQPKIKDSDWKIFGEWLKKAREVGKEAWVAEMQAEPWPKEGERKVFKDPLENRSCKPEDLKLYFFRLRDLGFKNILLWGAEFWVKCAQEGNWLWLEAVQELGG